jgi:prepilin-type N-terminal cleavage/methylation domain-containing protein
MQRFESERGFTLLELLVAATIMLVVLAGSITAFNDARRVTDKLTRMTDTNQNLRASVNLMVRDLMQTGRNIPTGGIPIPAGAGAAAVKRPGPPGTTLTMGAGTTTLAGVIPAAAVGPTLNGVVTDMATVLYDDPTLALNAFQLNSIAADGSNAVVNAGTPLNGATNAVAAGDLILFSNAVGNAIQTVTRVNGQTMYFDAGDAFLFNQRAAAQGTIMQIRTGATFPPTTATRILMVTYYIDAAAVPATPRLIRQQNFGPARLIAQGIENLQISYDIVDGVTNPTNQKTPVAPNSPQQIRNVNLFVAARATPIQLPGEQAVRSAVATQVSLRSMSFMDRYK